MKMKYVFKLPSFVFLYNCLLFYKSDLIFNFEFVVSCRHFHCHDGDFEDIFSYNYGKSPELKFLNEEIYKNDNTHSLTIPIISYIVSEQYNNRR